MYTPISFEHDEDPSHIRILKYKTANLSKSQGHNTAIDLRIIADTLKKHQHPDAASIISPDILNQIMDLFISNDDIDIHHHVLRILTNVLSLSKGADLDAIQNAIMKKSGVLLNISALLYRKEDPKKLFVYARALSILGLLAKNKENAEIIAGLPGVLETIIGFLDFAHPNPLLKIDLYDRAIFAIVNLSNNNVVAAKIAKDFSHIFSKLVMGLGLESSNHIVYHTLLALINFAKLGEDTSLEIIKTPDILAHLKLLTHPAKSLSGWTHIALNHIRDYPAAFAYIQANDAALSASSITTTTPPETQTSPDSPWFSPIVVNATGSAPAAGAGDFSPSAP